MELETLFSEQRWNILSCLSEAKYSPLQLANKLNTTIANISQQLRLLEAASLVKTEKIQARDKGKPRKLFSLSNDYAYLISTMQDFSDKKLLELTDHHKIILRIWFIENTKLHYDLLKFYLKIEGFMSQINAFGVNVSMNEVIVVSESNAQKKIESVFDELKLKTDVKLRLFDMKQADRLIRLGKEPFTGMSVIYDPEKMVEVGRD